MNITINQSAENIGDLEISISEGFEHNEVIATAIISALIELFVAEMDIKETELYIENVLKNLAEELQICG